VTGCDRLAKQLEDTLFSLGGSALVRASLENFLRRPVIREVKSLLGQHSQGAAELIVEAQNEFIESIHSLGSRPRESANAQRVLLTASASDKLVNQRMVTAASDLLGVRWHSMRNACADRAVYNARIAEEAHAGKDEAGWAQKARGTYSSKIDMAAAVEWMHDECRFASEYSMAIRLYFGVKIYELHWRRTLPCAKGALHARWMASEQYRKYKASGGRDCTSSHFEKHICKCMVPSSINQCADPIDTIVEQNLEVWDRLRIKWHEEAEDTDCGCSCTNPASLFRKASSSLNHIEAWLLCPKEADISLAIPSPDEHEGTPEFHRRECLEGTCLQCPMHRIEELFGACAVENGAVGTLNCWQYVNVQRSLDEDGNPRFQKELHKVQKSSQAFLHSFAGDLKRYFLHRHADDFGRQSDRLSRHKFRQQSGDLENIVIYTDFSSRASLESKHMATCQSSPLATCCVAIVLHSPDCIRARVTQEVDGVAATSTIRTVQGTSRRQDSRVDGTGVKREATTVEMDCFRTDWWRSYSTGKGNAQWHHTFMRDIVNYYKTGILTHAELGWCDGAALPTTQSEPPGVALIPELPELKQATVNTDGAGSQYVCCEAALGTARFYADTWCRLVHNVCERHCGKGVHDSAGKDAIATHKRHVAETGEVINDALSWVRLLATRKLVSPAHAASAHKDFAANRYFHLYYPDSTLDRSTGLCKLAAKRLDSVREYRQFVGGTTSHEAALEVGGYWVSKREASCNCNASDLTGFGQCSHMKPCVRELVQPANEVEQAFLRSRAVAEMVALAVPRAMVAVAGDDIDREFEGERKWWLGEVCKAPHKVVRNDKAHKLGIRAGSWAVQLKWCTFGHALADSLEYTAPQAPACYVVLKSLMSVKLSNVERSRSKRTIAHSDVEKIEEQMSWF
jgi:hypothetical protein